MKRVMAYYLFGYIVLVKYMTIRFIEGSITGVTYMDDFDFEERYTNINECNPLYWQPFHLPEECSEIFKKMLRTGLKYSLPYSIVRERHEDYLSDYLSNSGDRDDTYYGRSSFEMLFQSLRRDVLDRPRAPSFAFLPQLGFTALYKQPVSYKTADMIKKLAHAYNQFDEKVLNIQYKED